MTTLSAPIAPGTPSDATPAVTRPRPAAIAFSTACAVPAASPSVTAILMPERHASAVAPQKPDQSPVSKPRLIVSYNSPNGWNTTFRTTVPNSRNSSGIPSSSHSHASPTLRTVQSQPPVINLCRVSIVVATHGRLVSIHAQASPRRLMVQFQGSFSQSRTSSILSTQDVLMRQSQAVPAISTAHCQPPVSHPLISSTFSAQSVSRSHSQPDPRTLIVQSHALDSACLTRSIASTHSRCRSHSHAAPTVLMVQFHA